MSVFIGSTKVAGGPTVSQQLYSPDKYYNDGDSVIHNGNVWKRSGSGSGVEPGTDYNVWNVGFSNENLLDNPWFTINQRGQTIYDGWNKYTVDRWYVAATNPIAITSCEVVDDGVKVSASQHNAIFMQTFNSPLDATKVYTVSLKLNDSIYAFSFVGEMSVGVYPIQGLEIYVSKSGVSYTVISGNVFTFQAVKLELGPISTLANDTAPNYATELMKCQRYFYKGTATCNAGPTLSASKVLAFTYPTPMRISPSLQITAGTIFGWFDIPISSLEYFWKTNEYCFATFQADDSRIVGGSTILYYEASADL